MSAKKTKSSPKALPNQNHDQSQPAKPPDVVAIPFQEFVQKFAEGFVGEAMADRQFWIDRAAEFERLANRYPDIDVDGDLGSCLWWFWRLPPGAEDDLKIAARNAARGLPDRKASWCRWINFVRDFTLHRDWGFKLVEYTMPQTCKKGPSELRLERFRASLCDAAENKPQWTSTNLSAQLREFERATLEEQAKAFQEEPGVIKSFFESSARVCRELASLASDKVGTHGRRNGGRRPAALKQREKVIRKALRDRDNPAGLDYAKYLDRAGLTTPEAWQRDKANPCPRTHELLFQNSYWKQRLQDEKSKIAQTLKNEKALADSKKNTKA